MKNNWCFEKKLNIYYIKFFENLEIGQYRDRSSWYGVDWITALLKGCKVSWFSVVESIHLNVGNTGWQSKREFKLTN